MIWMKYKNMIYMKYEQWVHKHDRVTAPVCMRCPPEQSVVQSLDGNPRAAAPGFRCKCRGMANCFTGVYKLLVRYR